MRWTIHLEGGPRRVNHAAVAIGNRIFSFGGYCSGEDYENTRPMDVHILNTVSLRWHLLPFEDDHSSTPYQRYGHTAVEYENNAYIWGGRNDSIGACNKLFRFNGVTLKWDRPQVYGRVPDARDGHSACIVNGCMYIFAGYEELMDCFSNELRYLDLNTFTWHNVPAKEVPARWRDFHTATPVEDTIYVFGGRCDVGGNQFTNNELYCNKIMAFNTTTNTWSRPNISMANAPCGRRSHSAFLYDGFIYIFGGFNGKTGMHYNDLHKLNLNTMQWTKLMPFGVNPTPRRRQCACVVGNKVFIFGGTSPKSPDQVPHGWTTESDLTDRSDLHVLDFAPSLRTLASIVIIENNLSWSGLPHDVRWDLEAMTTDNTISRMNVTNG